MSTEHVPNLYAVVRGVDYQLRTVDKVAHKGTLHNEVKTFEECGLLAAELVLALKLVKMPTVLRVIDGERKDAPKAPQPLLKTPA